MMQTIRRHKIFSVLAFLVALFLLAVVCIVLFSEPIIKSMAEKKGAATLGRELAIDGDFKIHWHWIYTQVHAEKIRLVNAPGFPEANMATLERLDFTFKPLKLLLGRLEFGEIVLDKPFLVLDKKSATQNNWDFPIFSEANVATKAALPQDRHDFPIFRRLELREGKVIYRDAVKGMNLNLKLDSVSGEGGADNQKNHFTVAGNGTMQKQKFTVKATGGPLDSLRDTNKPYPLNVKIVMGSTHVDVDGVFKDPIRLTGIDASLKINGNSMSDLFYLTAIPLPPTPPYHLDGRLTKNGGVWGYEDFKGLVGGSDLSGKLSYDTSKTRGFLRANLVSQSLNSVDLGGFIGLSPSGESATPEQKKAAEQKKASDKLIPDVPLKLERLRATDLDVTLKAEKIVAPALPFKGMEVRFDLRNGILKLDPLKVVLADGTVDGSIEVDANQDIPPMKLNLNLHRLSLHQFFANTRFAKATDGFFGGKVDLAGKGVSLANVLATSNGDLTIIMSGGKISLLLIEGSDLDIAQALPLFLGKDKSTRIRCGVTDFDVKDGLLTSKTVVLDTADSLLVGNVKIDMKREVINAKLDAKPKDSSPLSAQTPIVLSGHLKSPSIGVDAKRATEKGAAAVLLGSLLTPLAAILPFIEHGDVKDSNCQELIAAAKNN